MSQQTAIDVYIGPEHHESALRADVEAGLTATPKELPPKWFYDEAGSALFDQITRVPEYYPTEAERQILLAVADSVIAATSPSTVIELGSGTSDKTAAILDAGVAAGVLKRFVPFDVSEEFLRASVDELASRYPTIDLHGVVGDFDHHLQHLRDLPGDGKRLLLFLGGTLGNYRPAGRSRLLADIANVCETGDHVLIGVDLVKDVDRLELAYDDPQGVTAAFNKNVLAVINRELAADFEPDAFEHVARFDTENEWIEMLLRSRIDQQVKVGDLGLVVDFAGGELMRTEVSCKFRQDGFVRELELGGFELVEWMTDTNGDFAVALARRQ